MLIINHFTQNNCGYIVTRHVCATYLEVRFTSYTKVHSRSLVSKTESYGHLENSYNTLIMIMLVTFLYR